MTPPLTFDERPMPVPYDLDRCHPALAATCRAAALAAGDAQRRYDRSELQTEVAMGADGTPTMLIDRLVEEVILTAAAATGVNVVSEEAGFVDNGSGLTLLVDPLDGSANAAAGVPLSCFSAALLDDGRPIEALTCWLETGETQWAAVGEEPDFRTSGARTIAGSALSSLRPKVGAWGDTGELWLALSRRAARVRILSSSCLEALLVARGAVDAFCDPGSDTHRIVDLAAAMIIVPAAGGAVRDAFGRELTFDPDLTRRYSGVVAASPELADEICTMINSFPLGAGALAGSAQPPTGRS